jgi:hypothetical protein
MKRVGPRAVLALLILNIVLQCYDGVTTYLGLQAGLIAEGNPFLAHAFREIGPAVALGLSKVVALYLLVLIWRMRQSWLAAPALGFLGAYYSVIALTPWALTLIAR